MRGCGGVRLRSRAREGAKVPKISRLIYVVIEPISSQLPQLAHSVGMSQAKVSRRWNVSKEL